MKIPEKQYSTRCPISHRPPFRTGAPAFTRCRVCGAVSVHLAPAGDFGAPPEVRCCGAAAHVLAALPDETDGAHALSFVAFGGFEHSALRIFVGGGAHPMAPGHSIEWVYLRTYQGGQLKYLPTRGASAVTFALAEEDAYAYCDRDVCKMGREHCQFQCKRGLIAYAHCSVHGLFRLPL